MATDEESGEEKKFPASLVKLRKLRRKGTVSHSKDFVAAMATLCLLLVLAGEGPSLGVSVQAYLLAIVGEIAAGQGDAAGQATSGLVVFLQTIMPLLGFVAGVVLLAHIVDSGGFLVSGEALSPNLAKLNPMKGLKKLAGMRSLVELLKSLIKLVLIAGATLVVFVATLGAGFWSPLCGGPSCLLGSAKVMLGAVGAIGVAALLVSGLVDLWVSRALFRHEQKMTLTELKREQKEEYGDAEVRKGRKSFARDTMRPPPQGLGPATPPSFWLASAHRAIGLYFRDGETEAPVVLVVLEGAARDRALAAAGETQVYRSDKLTDEIASAAMIGRYIAPRFYASVARLMAGMEA